MIDAAGGFDPDKGIRDYVDLLRRYHGGLDLMSQRGLERLDYLIEDAEMYAAEVKRLGDGGTVLDVGTGAGLPAVVIAARSPRRRMAWVERRRRRATFLRSVVARCRLERVAVHAADVRELDVDVLGSRAGTVTAQAVGGWPLLYRATAHLHEPSVTLVARRGGEWEAECSAFEERLAAPVQVQAALPLGGGGTLVALRVLGGLPCR